VLRGARWAAPLLIAMTVVSFGAPAGARTPAKPSARVADPCSYLTTSQVQKTFGGPVTPMRPTLAPASSTVCNFQVGVGGGGGTLVVALLYPFFPPPGQTGVDVIESQHADDTVTGHTIETVSVGKFAYADLDLSVVYVAASKKFAFSLQWLPPGVSPPGSTLTPKVEKQLVALAKVVVARSR